MAPTNITEITKSLSRGEIVFLVILSVSSFIARLINIDFKTYSIDEVYCVFLVNQPWKQFFHMLVDGPAGRFNLYFVFLKIIHEIFGTSHFTMRILSAIAGGLMVAPFYLTARFFTGKHAASISTVLFSFSPLVLYYGQDARQYSVMFLVISVFLLVWTRILTEGKDFALLYAIYVISILIHPINYYFGFAILTSVFIQRKIIFSKKDFALIPIITVLFLIFTYIHFKQFSDPYWNVLTPEYKIDFHRFKYVVSFLFSLREEIALLFFLLGAVGIFLFKNIRPITKFFIVFFVVPLPIPLYIAVANFFPHNFGSRYLSFLFPLTLIGLANSLYIISSFIISEIRRFNDRIINEKAYALALSSFLIASAVWKDWLTSYEFIYLVPVKATEGADYRRPLEYIAQQNENFPVLIDPFRNVESRFYFYYFMYLKPIDEKRQIISFRYFDNFKKKQEKIGIKTFVRFPLTPEKFREFDWSKYKKLGWFIPFFWIGFKAEPFDTLRFFKRDDWRIYPYVIKAEEEFKRRGYKTKLFYNSIYIEHDFKGTLEDFLDRVLEVSEIFFDSLSELKGGPQTYSLLVVYETFERAKAHDHLSRYLKKFPNISSIYKIWWEKALSKE